MCQGITQTHTHTITWNNNRIAIVHHLHNQTDLDSDSIVYLVYQTNGMKYDIVMLLHVHTCNVTIKIRVCMICTCRQLHDDLSLNDLLVDFYH